MTTFVTFFLRAEWKQNEYVNWNVYTFCNVSYQHKSCHSFAVLCAVLSVTVWLVGGLTETEFSVDADLLPFWKKICTFLSSIRLSFYDCLSMCIKFHNSFESDLCTEVSVLFTVSASCFFGLWLTGVVPCVGQFPGVRFGPGLTFTELHRCDHWHLTDSLTLKDEQQQGLFNIMYRVSLRIFFIWSVLLRHCFLLEAFLNVCFVHQAN